MASRNLPVSQKFPADLGWPGAGRTMTEDETAGLPVPSKPLGSLPDPQRSNTGPKFASSMGRSHAAADSRRDVQCTDVHGAAIPEKLVWQ